MSRAVIISIAAVILVFSIAAQSYAFQKCGFIKAMSYGEGAFWAAIGGYCDN